MRLSLDLGLGSVATLNAGGGVSFADIMAEKGLAWFDSRDLSDNPVSTWLDKSPFARSLSQTGTKRPALTAGKVVGDGGDDILIDTGVNPVATFSAAVDVPDVSDSPSPGNGYTNTGLCWDSVENCWWDGDYGLEGVEGADATFNAKIVQVSADRTTKLAEFLVLPHEPTAQGMQGVAVDTVDLLVGGLITNLKKIVLFEKDGTYDRSVSIDAAITNPNGLAFDAPTNSWLVSTTDNTVYRINKAGAIIGGPWTLRTTGAIVDHITHDPLGRNWVWYGTVADVYAWDLDTDAQAAFFTCSGMNQGEGIAWQDATNFWFAHDGFYHTGTPGSNQVRHYTVSAYVAAYVVYPSEINLFFVAPVATNTSIDCLFGWSDPLAVPGLGVYVSTSTQLRVITRAGAGAGTINFTLPTTTRQGIRVRVDAVAETVECWVDEVQIGTAQSISSITGGVVPLGPMRILGSIESAVETRQSSASFERIIVQRGALTANEVAASWAQLAA